MSYQAYYDPGNNPDYPYFVRVHYSAIQEIKALTDAITIHIGPED